MGSTPTAPRQKTALVTGANGFIGRNVANTFAIAGFKTYGLIRRENVAPSLAAHEITPVLGSFDDLDYLPALLTDSPTFDVIVSTTEQLSSYVEHYEQIVELIRTVAQASNDAGVRPLVLFTSGCKDYGKGTLVDDPALAPHTEASPIAPEEWARARAENALRIFDHGDLFDAALFRPVTLFGYDGSYYGPYFDLAEKGQKGSGVLEMPSDPRTVLHGMHVQDVAGAYLTVAQADRELVKGQCFNLSSWRYETIAEIAESLVKEYGLKEVKYVTPREDDVWASKNAGFTQWVGSEKIRKLLGWKDHKPLFTEDIHVYRMAYDAATHQGHEGVARIKNKFAPKA